MNSFKKFLLLLVLTSVIFILFYQFSVMGYVNPKSILHFRSIIGANAFIYETNQSKPQPTMVNVSNILHNVTAKSVKNVTTTAKPKGLTTTPKPPQCKNPFRKTYVEKKNFICCNPIGRTGNRLFIYASAYGIAKSLNRTLVLNKEEPLSKFFNLSAVMVDDYKCVTFGSSARVTRRDCAFDKNMLNIPEGKNYCVGMYLQSFMYFEHVKDDLRKQLTFAVQYRTKARTIINTAIETFKNKTKRTGNAKLPVLVGVHVRRGDMVKHTYGYNVATPQYMNKATKYFREKYKDVLFIVCSNGMAWAKENIKGDDVYFVEGNESIIDMAVLVSCNHTLSTVGSFSWWVGFMTGGDVTYFQWPAKNGSRLIRRFNFSQYFPESWIGLN